MVHLNAPELTAPRREFFFPVPALARCLHDPRDAPVLYLFANILCYLALALPLLLRFRDSHLAGAAYFGALFALFFERFILALHFHAHRPLTTHPLLNEVPQYLLAPLFGIPPGVYAAHHTVMHHVEGNVFPRDLSSTECYDRGSPAHFVAYWARFLFLSAVELPWYAAAKQRYALAAHLLASFAGTGVAYSAAYAASPVLATWTLLVPLVVGSFLLMLGNWSQHIFINPADPDSPYGITYDLINTPANQKTFNDGYHLQHHLNSRRHWSELPRAFQEHVEELKQRDALVFSGLSFIEVGACVFLQRYDTLTTHFVDVQDRCLARAQTEKLLRARLRPVHRWRDGKVVR